MKKQLKRVTVFLLSAMMLISGISPSVFAASGSDDKYDESNRELTVNYTEESGSGVLSFSSAAFSSGTITLGGTDYNITRTYTDKADSREGTFKRGSDEYTLHLISYEDEETYFTHVFELVPVRKDILSGTVYEYDFGKSPSTGTAKNLDFNLTHAGGTVEIAPSSSGSFSYTVPSGSETDSGSYSWARESTDTHLTASGKIKAGEASKVYVEKRYVPTSSDYKLSDQDGVIDGWVNQEGTYTFEGTGANKLSSSLDGEEADTLTLVVDADGNVTDTFYVYKDGSCSVAVTNAKVKIDGEAPDVTGVSTRAGDDETYVKEHGIYSKKKAELIIKATISEPGIGLKRVYLIGKDKDGTQTEYETTKIEGTSGEYKATIGLPDEETMLKARIMYIVAEDKFGNQSTEVLISNDEDSSSVTLETVPPSLTANLSAKPNANGWFSSEPTFTAKAEDAVSGLFSLRLYQDDELIHKDTYDKKVLDKKSGSIKVDAKDASDDGSYIMKAIATDNAGNTSEKTIKVKVDLVNPVLSTSGVSNGRHYRMSPTIKIYEDEKYYNADGAYIRYIVKRDGKLVTDKTLRKVDAGTIPGSTFSQDGRYTVEITAKDASGREAKKINHSFVKDATSPVVDLSGVQNGRFYARAQTVTATVKERFFDTNNVYISATRTLSGNTINVGFPWTNEGATSSSSKSFSETGTYTISIYAVDKAGNRSNTETLTFTVDQIAPEITITGVTDGAVYIYGQTVAPRVKFFDHYPGSESVSYTKGGVPITNPSFEPVKENDGVYTLTATATDKAGNTTTKTVTFTINRFGSYFIYNDAIKNLQGKAVQRVEDALVVTEKNVSKVVSTDAKIFRDGKALEEKASTSKNEEGAEKTYKHTYDAAMFETEGAYEINVISKDEAGNEMESKEENGAVKFYVDRTPPSLSLTGIDPKGNKAESIVVSINTSDLLTGVQDVKAYIDGQETYIDKNEEANTLTFNVGSGMKQEVKVTAVDGAGNKAEVVETASVSASAFKLFLNRFKTALAAVGAGLLALLGIFFALFKRRKKDEEEEAPNSNE